MVFAIEISVNLGVTVAKFGLEVFGDIDELSAPRSCYGVAKVVSDLVGNVGINVVADETV